MGDNAENYRKNIGGCISRKNQITSDIDKRAVERAREYEEETQFALY